MAIAVGDAPPSEFRIFRAGWNESTKGRVLFDEDAAAAVMAAYSAHGVDVMIDLEHLSLEQESRSFDPDARGWCRLEVRGGELWAVDVRWTTDGQMRLTEKRQRYVSPAFWTDPETKRVTEITNIAITAMPATHGAMPLVAASKRGRAPGRLNMADGLTIENLPAFAKALGMPGDAPLEDVMAAIRAIVMAVDGEPQPTAETPVEEPASEELSEATDEDEEDEEEEKAMAATGRELLRMSGKSSPHDALEDAKRWRSAYVERAAWTRDREMIDEADRAGLIAELVKLGAETPSTAFVDPLAKTRRFCDRLAKEPIGDMRKRVSALRLARGGKAAPTVAPPRSAGGDGKTFATPHGAVTLTSRQLRFCEETGAKPEVYAANLAAQHAARSGSAA